MNIEIDNSKRVMVCYSSGEYPNIMQSYYIINYKGQDRLNDIFDDIDNMTEHLVKSETGETMKIPYCDRERAGTIDVGLTTYHAQGTAPDKDQQKAEIKRNIDSLLELLSSLK